MCVYALFDLVVGSGTIIATIRDYRTTIRGFNDASQPSLLQPDYLVACHHTPITTTTSTVTIMSLSVGLRTASIDVPVIIYPIVNTDVALSIVISLP